MDEKATPLVSIMTITYNGVRWLKDTIDSMQAQVYKNWELIIQDDCSSDGTWELAEKLSERDPRIKVFRNAKNVGIPNNRANAIEHCTGEYTGHLDQGDTLYPWSIQRIMDAFFALPDVALVYSDRAYIDEHGVATSYTATKNFVGPLHQFGWMHLGVYKMSVYNSLAGFNRKLTAICEDGDLFMQIVEHHKAFRVPEVLYKYRNPGTHASSRGHKCGKCPDQPICNFYRVWTTSADYDPVTFTPRVKIPIVEEKK